jgi:glycosyl hydrolase family 123
LRCCLIAVFVLLVPSFAGAGDVTILGPGSVWRSHATWATPVIRAGGEVKTESGNKWWGSLRVQSPEPPAAWPTPGFADRDWPRLYGPRALTSRDAPTRWLRHVYGVWGGASAAPALARICLRARFRVADPAAAKPLRLSMAYRGGVVVYVNGVEVARQHLSAGKLAADALADDYPPKAFESAPGKPISSHHSSVKKYAENLKLRVRRLQTVIAPKRLRLGVNVIAVEIRRSAFYGNALRTAGYRVRNHPWTPCGLVGFELRSAGGVEPNVGRPKGVQVWPASTLTRLGTGHYADPLDTEREVRIVAARNGTFTGKVVVSSGSALKGVRAEMGALTSGGKRLPASAVSVLYGRYDGPKPTPWGPGWLDGLHPTPPASVPVAPKSGAVLPIWIKVRVPSDATGVYTGKMTVHAGQQTVEVPVRLTVIDWTLPDTKDFTTHIGAVQSPESVAMKYKVPLWSPKHWKLLESSFRLLGEVGNKTLIIHPVGRTNFGNTESMIRWIRKGAPSTGSGHAAWSHDFSVLERYLDLALKYTRPKVVCFYAWSMYMGGHARFAYIKRTTRGPKITVLDPKTGATENVDGPAFGTPGAKAFWKPVCDGVVERLAKRGLADKLMLGLTGDGRPSKECAALFRELLPKARWVSNSHHDRRGRNFFGTPIGWCTAVYVRPMSPPGGKRRYGWQAPTALFPRFGQYINTSLRARSSLPMYRSLPEIALLGGLNGIGRVGADFWQVLTPPRNSRARSRTINARFPWANQAQLNINATVEALFAPGPNGAATTERFEMLREGVQESEARVFIEKLLADAGERAKLGEALARRAQTVLDARHLTLRAALIGQRWDWLAAHSGAAQTRELFQCAADVANALRQPAK